MPGARAPTTYPPGTTAPGPPLPSPCTHPHPTGYPSKKTFFFFLYALETSKIRRKLRNLLRPWGPCPYHLPPPAPKPLEPRAYRGLPFFGTAIQPLRPNPLLQPRPLVYRPVHQASSGGYPPTPQGILQKTSFFFFLYALETSKIRRKLRNLLRPWGPCPYHLHPRNQSPWTPPPEPLYPPHPTGYILQKNHFAKFAPSLGPQPRGLLFSVWTQPSPFFQTAIQPLRPPQPSPATKALGLPPCPPGQLRWVPPHPTGHPSKNIIFLFFCTR